MTRLDGPKKLDSVNNDAGDGLYIGKIKRRSWAIVMGLWTHFVDGRRAVRPTQTWKPGNVCEC